MSVYDHPDWHALVRTIRDRPGNDLPRLVAADWLEERGEDLRARFIRELPPRYLHQEGLGAFVEFMDFGTDPLVSPRAELWPMAEGCQFGTHRGFIESVRCPWEWWAEHGDTLCLREPVTRVELTTWPVVRVWVAGDLDRPGVYMRLQDPHGTATYRLPAGEDDGGMEEAHVPKLLVHRWPLIPVYGWVLPPIRFVEPEDVPAAGRRGRFRVGGNVVNVASWSVSPPAGPR